MRAGEFLKESKEDFPSGGDCFESALQELMHSNPFGKDHMDNMTMVHAAVTGQGEIEGVKHGHAWNEIGDVVLDKSNGRNIVMRKEQYYKAGNIDPNNTNEFKRYTRNEMAKMVSKFKTYGPWELPNDLAEDIGSNLTEYLAKGTRHHKYRDGGTPVDWFDKAVQLKKDNPHITAAEIGRQVKVNTQTVLRWLAGIPDSGGRIYNDNPPFTSKNFPNDGGRKYFDGEKPWWYEEAIKLRKQGMTYPAIADKLSSTPEKKVRPQSIQNWLVKGRKMGLGKLINLDAPFTPRPQAKRIPTALIKDMIKARYKDEDIIEWIRQDTPKLALAVKEKLPQLRAEMNEPTQVMDKVTGQDITGFVGENSQDN